MCSAALAAIDQFPSRIDELRADGREDLIEEYRQHLTGAAEDLAGLRRAELYWVARDMVDLAVDAASTLPEWSPSAAMPASDGLLCWGKPAGTFKWPIPGGDQSIDAPVDAMSWGVRDGQVGVVLHFKQERAGREALRGLVVPGPMVVHACGLWDVDEPVDYRLPSGAISPLSVLGAAWLLMSQPRVVAVRQLPPTESGKTSGLGAPLDEHQSDQSASGVSIIELRKIMDEEVPTPATPRSPSSRWYTKRWWVGGHWRQQAWGPNRALRKPLWIAPYVKGPNSAPLSTRVNVWRR